MDDRNLIDTPHKIGPAYRETLPLAGGRLVLARKEHLLSLFAAGGDLVHLDLEGRLHRAWLGGDSYQRGLDGRIRRVAIERGDAFRALAIDVLPDAAAAPLLARTAALVREAAGALPSRAPASLAGPLARATRWDHARYAGEARLFASTYDPIPILPPDQNRALVLQLTSGCSWNRCTFCHLYRDATFALKTAEELRAHIRTVLALVGRALPLRRGIFLGQANALVIAEDKLLPLLDVVAEEMARVAAPRSFSTLAAFIDSFTRPKTAGELRALRARGLASVALGLESGSAEVLAALGKPAAAAAAIALAHTLRAAGVGLGIIVLAGAGGRKLAAEHVAATVETIAAMAPARGDRIYLSPLVIHPGSVYEAQSGALAPLSTAELVAEAAGFRTALRAAGVTVPIALYDIRRFIY
jgi:hypothetical protein